MTEQAIKLAIIEKAGELAKEIKRGKDIEIKTSGTGLKIFAVDKKRV